MINFFFVLSLVNASMFRLHFFYMIVLQKKKRSQYAKGSLAVKLSEVINMQLLPIISILYQADR